MDRYRPQQYTDLLGDDRVHREVMTWVKEWDYCVFGKSKGKQKLTEDGHQFDEYRRPREKVNQLFHPVSHPSVLTCDVCQLLLVSGPPGLGKTTLAHVIAKQAGYKVFEINARSVVRPEKVTREAHALVICSDARSGAVVDDRIRPALESGAAIGSSKPVLVIIDEIDGATGAGDTVRPLSTVPTLYPFWPNERWKSTGFIQRLIALTQDNPKRKRMFSCLPFHHRWTV